MRRSPPGTRVLVQPIINDEGYNLWRNNAAFRSRLAAILKKATAAMSLTQRGVAVEFMREEGIKSVYLPNAAEVYPGGPDFRTTHGIRENEFVILDVANLCEIKNHLGLLDALKGLPHNCRLVMIGYPTATEYSTRVQTEIRNHPHVLFIPGLPPDGVADAVEAADAVALGIQGGSLTGQHPGSDGPPEAMDSNTRLRGCKR